VRPQAVRVALALEPIPAIHRPSFFVALAAGASLLACIGAFAASPADDDMAVASQLAEMLRSSRTVISQYQDLINDPTKEDKQLTPERVLAETVEIYRKQTGRDPEAMDQNSREGRLLRAEMEAIRDVVAENQSTINRPGVGFKGFIPAVFARLVSEKFSQKAGEEARIKVTAPELLIRNRRARPDDWETAVLTERFAKPEWIKGEPFSEHAKADGRSAFRLLVPEYYRASCLSCHGTPAGEMDITGYPKEGGKEGDLGAAISIALFR
jgi:hypothetical protein